ncbi:HPr(Ser) kinase/phosphatase [Chromatium okenii]|jgi:HPr kinase/phosphorylase|uniref:HPr kinase/phosphorylase n=1 Tax=Chromatium okenii TaxID=61644 RepID=A0A2S7XSB3_9GAMM|nr:HPr(Ser) kinase/phosphatase [Chromatium okenii]PQJ96605.1 HPr(Ser) kinase/phosphatase [Chromatium okenii]
MIDSLQALIAQTGTQLKLHWVTAEPDMPRSLRGIGPEQTRQSLIGSLNCIHPNRLQIIGQQEQTYLSALGTNAFADTVEKLFSDHPAAVIFTDGVMPDAALLAAAERTQTPLLASTLIDQDLINHLRYFLTHALAERKTLHGVFIEVLGMGVLLIGNPAVGKSELALELITRGHRLIADDAPRFARIAPDVLEGTCPELLRDFLEVRGLGILNIRAMFGEGAVLRSKTLNLIIDLQPLDQQQLACIDRLTGSLTIANILEVTVPKVLMPVAPGRNLAILVEAAVRHQILRIRGYDASEDFTNRQARAIDVDQSDPPMALR